MEDENDEEETAVSTPSTVPQDRSGSTLSLPSLSQITSITTSPSAFSTGAIRHYSTSSTSQPSYSPYIHSNQASPAFAATNMPTPYSATRENFIIGSPALKALDSVPQIRQATEGSSEAFDKQRREPKAGRSEHELDQEATAALLMLNHDRRNWRSEKDGASRSGNGGMSVKDLLSG